MRISTDLYVYFSASVTSWSIDSSNTQHFTFMYETYIHTYTHTNTRALSLHVKFPYLPLPFLHPLFPHYIRIFSPQFRSTGGFANGKREEHFPRFSTRRSLWKIRSFFFSERGGEEIREGKRKTLLPVKKNRTNPEVKVVLTTFSSTRLTCIYFRDTIFRAGVRANLFSNFRRTSGGKHACLFFSVQEQQNRANFR